MFKEVLAGYNQKILEGSVETANSIIRVTNNGKAALAMLNLIMVLNSLLAIPIAILVEPILLVAEGNLFRSVWRILHSVKVLGFHLIGFLVIPLSLKKYVSINLSMIDEFMFTQAGEHLTICGEIFDEEKFEALMK